MLLHNHKERIINPNDSMNGTYLGPEFTNKEIIQYLKEINANFHTQNDSELFELIAEELDKGSVIGWFNGSMEFGPRALGARSIIGDPRNPDMQSKMNLKIKFRESFRPFAPSVIEEDASNIFEISTKSPYMLLVALVKKKFLKKITESQKKISGIEKLNIPRSSIPAITHVDNSARVQTVRKETNPRYHELIASFKKKTGCPLIINTSFNVRGEPIVNTPTDAFKCFMGTDLDVLVIGNCFLKKENQNIELKQNYKNKYELD